MRVVELSRLFETVAEDERLTMCHLVVWLALFECWNRHHFVEPVSITRQQVMRLAKVKRNTYHRCMRDLHAFGYIRYVPSYHPILGSVVYLSEGLVY